MNIRAWVKYAAAMLAAWKTRLAILAIGHTFNELFDWFFNYPLYGYIIDHYGIRAGYPIMTVLSFITCLIFIRLYDWAKVDWLGIELAKEMQDVGSVWIKNINIKSRFGCILWWPFSKLILLILWAAKKGGWVAFLVFSILTDPFITTVYMRKGWGEYNGLSRRGWMIFLASTIVGNAWWSGRTWTLLKFLGVKGYIALLLLLICLIAVGLVIKKKRERKK